jgi:hypothetical protein
MLDSRTRNYVTIVGRAVTLWRTTADVPRRRMFSAAQINNQFILVGTGLSEHIELTLQETVRHERAVAVC